MSIIALRLVSDLGIYCPFNSTTAASPTLIGARRQVLWMRAPLWKTLWARQRFLGSMRDFALFGLVLMLHALYLLGKY
jgi:hypothetical protein